MKLSAVAVLLLVSLFTPCWGQGSGSGDADKHKLVEQKYRLIETLLNAPTANAAESAALTNNSRRLLGQAREAMNNAKWDEAARLLDEALKAASSASRKISPDGSGGGSGGSGLSEAALQKSLADKAQQVATYRASLVDMTRDPKQGVAARQLLARLDVLLSEAKQLSDGGRLSEANKKMAAAYKLTVEEIAKLRAGQEVVLSLTFETPADEYAYEQRRFDSNLTLVEMMVAEGRAEGQKRGLVNGFVTEGQRLKTLAHADAEAKRHKAAVELMEQASGQLNKALQSMGLPVF
ncbi:MAG: hypothetical protein IPH35_04850 [Rhodoferax sp.]|nr:hypothetical protein [Rhodoferax sp.]